MKNPNPFQIGGVVLGDSFANRTAELDRIQRVLVEGGAKLLIYGARRLGKTSAVHMAAHRLRGEGRAVVIANLSTVSAVSDIANRILQAASKELGRTWKDVVTDLAKRFAAAVQLTADPTTGMPVVSLGAERRRGDEEGQRTTLADVLDALEAMAEQRGAIVGVVLDEFQEIHRLGGERAEWHLKGVIESHQHLAYVLAGSDEGLIRQMLGKSRAFYKLFEILHLDPIELTLMSRWIEKRFRAEGVDPGGAPARIVRIGGPRTRDIVQLARAVYAHASGRGHVQRGDIAIAFEQVIRDEDDTVRVVWNTLTPGQQNVLRALAAGTEAVYGQAARGAFDLGPTGSIAAAIEALRSKRILADFEGRAQFDSPFVRGWVALQTLADVGRARTVEEIIRELDGRNA